MARYGKVAIVDDDAEIQFRIEATEPGSLDARRTALLTETNTLPEFRNTIAWLIALPAELDDHLAEACRSEMIVQNTPEREADRDVAQFLRAERRNAEVSRDRAQKALAKALQAGTFVFAGRPRPVTKRASPSTQQRERSSMRLPRKCSGASAWHRFGQRPICPRSSLPWNDWIECRGNSIRWVWWW